MKHTTTFTVIAHSDTEQPFTVGDIEYALKDAGFRSLHSSGQVAFDVTQIESETGA